MQYGKFMLFVVFVIVGNVQANSLNCTTPIQLEQGWVQGEEFQSTDGKNFCSYRALPFAEPPVGELRFQRPKAAGPWEGILNATKDAPMCPQINILTGIPSFNEDCLKLNVYTPHAPGASRFFSRLPVLVFIHGGGFGFGDAGIKSYAPHRFMNERVILVTIQYRLGALGFLSTASEDASGNYGLLDQQLALHWVKSNIRYFGGDPRRVVIFGESAGAASVVYQMVSKGSKGLISGVIAQSGTVLDPWSKQPDPFSYAQQLGDGLQCNAGNNKSALVACLRTRSAQSIIATMLSKGWYNSIISPFAPVVEDPEYGQFITENPKTVLEKGDMSDVPLICGTNQDEFAILFLGFPGADAFNNIPSNPNFFNVTLPGMIAQATRRKTNLLSIAQAVKEKYFDIIDLNNINEVRTAAIKFFTDLSFRTGAWSTARILAQRGFRVRSYMLEHAGNVSKTNFSGHLDIYHAQDLNYFFNMGVLTPGDEKFSREVITMWTNFARLGNPTPFTFRAEDYVKWKTVGRERSLRYLKLGEESNTMEYQSEDWIADEDFWNEQTPYSIDPDE